MSQILGAGDSSASKNKLLISESIQYAELGVLFQNSLFLFLAFCSSSIPEGCHQDEIKPVDPPAAVGSTGVESRKQEGRSDSQLDHPLALHQLLPVILPNHCQFGSTASKTEQEAQALLPAHHPCGPACHQGVTGPCLSCLARRLVRDAARELGSHWSAQLFQACDWSAVPPPELTAGRRRLLSRWWENLISVIPPTASCTPGV